MVLRVLYVYFGNGIEWSKYYFLEIFRLGSSVDKKRCVEFYRKCYKMYGILNRSTLVCDQYSPSIEFLVFPNDCQQFECNSGLLIFSFSTFKWRKKQKRTKSFRTIIKALPISKHFAYLVKCLII